MEAKELPINDIQTRDYYFVVSRYITDHPLTEPQIWSNYPGGFFLDEDKADLFVIEQRRMEKKPGYGGKKEWKKFIVSLPI